MRKEFQIPKEKKKVLVEKFSKIVGKWGVEKDTAKEMFKKFEKDMLETLKRFEKV